MRQFLLIFTVTTLGLLGTASPTAAQYGCGSVSTLQFNPVGGFAQCGTTGGAFTLAPGQLWLGGPVMVRPDYYSGGLFGTSAYGAGGASVRPGGWFPQVAGAPINAAQGGAFLGTGVSNIGLGLPSNPEGLPMLIPPFVPPAPYLVSDAAPSTTTPVVTFSGEVVDATIYTRPGQ
jgi:hypothetical protein